MKDNTQTALLIAAAVLNFILFMMLVFRPWLDPDYKKPHYTTPDEVHAIVDSVLVEVYD